MNFFFDRCMPYRLAHVTAALEVNAHTIRHHDDDPRFNKNTKDTEWLATLAKDNLPWIALSGDAHILKKAVERNALSEANLTFFVMSKSWCNTPIYDYAWKFLKAWPKILVAADTDVAMIFEVGGGHALKVEPVERSRR
jgi:hypothetical protein